MEPNDLTLASKLRRNLLLTLGLCLVTTVLFVLLSWLSLDTLDAVRGYVQGEGLWSKAQKEAVHQLERYAESGSEEDYRSYAVQLQVPLGDRRARQELQRARPDFRAVVAGFIGGRNEPADVPQLIALFRRFGSLPLMRDAIALWEEGDRGINDIIAIGDELHALIGTPAAAGEAAAALRGERIARALARLRATDVRLTPLEERFSATLGEASRRLARTLKLCTLALAAVLLALTGTLSYRMWRRNANIESALRTSEERFDLAVRGSNDGIWNWCSRGGGLYLSPRAIDVLGRPRELLPDAPTELLAFVHPDERDAVRQAIEETVASFRPLDVEFRFSDAQGAYRWARVRGGALHTGNGDVRVAGSISDVTERRRAEEQRQQHLTEEQFRAEQAQIALLEKAQGQMGRELHDDLGQQLTGIAFLAKALEQRLGVASPERDQTAWIVRLINEATDRVRFMSRQLSPIEIDEVTLGTALQRMVDDNQRIFGTHIALRKTGDETAIAGAHANQLFRIAQEAVSNALRHGRATQIVVRLDIDRCARLAVCDNGCGFRVRDIDLHASLGLRSMALRAAALHGRLRIRSSARGTTLVVHAPTLAAAAPAELRKIA